MKRLHVIGRKNHGKTTLVVALIEELTGRGLRVGTIKHTHHRHELDVPGKDSHRHRTAGATVVGVLSKGLSAVFLPSDDSGPSRDRYAPLATVFASSDLVLVEGDSGTTAPKIEVWRAEVGSRPLAEEDLSVLAVVTDDDLPTAGLTLPRSDLQTLADWVIAWMNRSD
ncbi:Molybdopterin-guanine dinucleotide biosynthesis adapter protein [Planctomycetes bacterium MalM25]|nr:Molybdopterin-guanine dinucleotide biosynthesis adapter protein [Planctomycetes bacterium MalM25]